MPRLLLVDDNPSIHKIAESLLSGSDVQVVCVEGGAQALALISRGEVFDVALVDIFMGGMDGWALLDAFRTHPATASMPVAMMAGVLDTVDPQRLDQARVQGYVKKPVELRGLPERVHTILAAGGPSSEDEPTVAMVSPFATAPAMAVKDLAPEAVSPLPEDLLFLTIQDLLEPDEAPLAEGQAILPLPEVPAGTALAERQEGEASEAPDFELEPDLEWEKEGFLDEGSASELHLDEEVPSDALATAEAVVREDLVPEAEWASAEAPAESEPVMPPAVPEPAPLAEAPQRMDHGGEALPDSAELPELAPTAAPETMEEGVPETLESLPEPLLSDALDAALASESLEDSVELPDLGPSAELLTPYSLPDAEEAPQATLPKDWDDSEELLSAIQAALPTALVPGPGETLSEPAPTGELISPQLELGVGAAMAAGAAAAAAASPTPTTAGLSAEALVEAILADPVALEKLGKALSKHLSQAALRDVAWEVMPDLADRLRPY